MNGRGGEGDMFPFERNDRSGRVSRQTSIPLFSQTRRFHRYRFSRHRDHEPKGLAARAKTRFDRGIPRDEHTHGQP